MKTSWKILSALITLGFLVNPFVAAAVLTDSAQINATTKYFSITSPNALSPSSGTLSLEGWVKFGTVPASDGDCVVIADLWNGSTPVNSYYFDVQNFSGTVKLSVGLNNGSASNSFSSGAFTPSTNTWYYVSVSMTGGTIKFFTGTELLAPTQLGSTITGAIQPQTLTSTSKFRISTNGAQSGDAGCNVTTPNIKTSTTRVWNTDQTGNFATNYCNVLGGTSGLLGEWTLDNTTADNSGNGNTLTNNGSTAFVADVPVCGTPGSGIIADMYWWWLMLLQ